MELGLTRPEIVTLIFLNFREGVTASDICEFSGHLKANISRGIIALEKKKLLRRDTDRSDNRAAIVHDARRPGALREIHPGAPRARAGDAAA